MDKVVCVVKRLVFVTCTRTSSLLNLLTLGLYDVEIDAYDAELGESDAEIDTCEAEIESLWSIDSNLWRTRWRQ
jgi:hypothetical protein